ncbi:unnamed protein product [Lupinus luteus]|uniref:Uncharacterized protein n=1 Tax=Lupinus luteus TaxID=3873 RepID=A0AAV1W5E4_LUPLU
MFSTKAELTQKSALQIKQDDKFFSRLLSKENSISYPSFRVALAIPFVWESQPGTPKYTFCEDTLPPLTPPPSYYSNSFNKKPVKNNNKGSRSNNLLMALFPKLNLKKTLVSSPSSFSSSSWSSSDNSSKVVSLGKNGRRRFLSYGSSIDFRGDGDVDEDGVTSPTSTLCFGITLSSSSKRMR